MFPRVVVGFPPRFGICIGSLKDVLSDMSRICLIDVFRELIGASGCCTPVPFTS